MALSILDGNQTSTTLATTVSGGAHYPNHIIASAVTIGSLPAISGTVTANGGDFASKNTTQPASAIQLGFQNIGGDFTAVNQDGASFPIRLNEVDGNIVVPISGTVTIGSLPAISGTVTANVANSITIGSLPSISGTVTANVANSVTVGSLPVQLSTTTIGGTARLNVTLSSATTVGGTAPSYANLYGGSDGTNLRAISVDSSGRTVVTGSTSILGTPSVTIGAISGTVTATVSSTTVTVSALPSGALTTRFGSVTTANLAQISTAVTNTSRKYLLCQNLDPSTTVTIGIGFTPTTTQGIQLAAGGGIIMDSFVSTGAVWWLSSTTGSNFTILEG